MKVLLVRPQAPNVLSFINVLDTEPLELEYLHTVLAENGIEDYIYDGLVEKVNIRDTILREKPDVLAVTGFITQEKLMKDFCQKAKEYDKNIITVIGGIHAQINYDRFYDPHVDYILRSEDCYTLVELINAAQKGLFEKLQDINGLCYRQDMEWRVNDLTPYDINKLPIPDRSFFNKNKSHYRYLDMTPVSSIKTSFSCPFNCNYCYCTILGCGEYQARDLNLVIEELKTIECENVQFVDDDLLVNAGRIKELIRLIRENNIRKKYICYARADFVAKNPDLIMELAEIGFRYFLVGLEAVKDESLTSYNKLTSVEINRQCVENINKTKTADCIALMIAPIDATREYFKELYEWIISNGLKYVTVSIFTPVIGTPLYEEYKDRIISDDIRDWDFLHLVVEPENLTRKEFYAEYRKLFIKLYRLAKSTGIYDFMDLKFYRDLVVGYFERMIRGN